MRKKHENQSNNMEKNEKKHKNSIKKIIKHHQTKWTHKKQQNKKAKIRISQ